MKRRPILAVAGLVLAAFGLGTWMGLRLRPRRDKAEIISMPNQAPRSTGVTALISASPCVDIRHAGPLVGKNGCVSGVVLRVYSSRSGNTFLDFCEDYRSCEFTSVVFSPDRSKFGDMGSLQGKRVEIRGDIINYQGRAEIIIRDPQQVRSAR